jgi:arachidonate 15-lipoxygenase
MYGTQQSNDIVTRGQMLRGGEFETIFSLSFKGMCRLFEESYGEFPMVTNDPQEDARRRGIRQQGFDTPTQDNLEAIFDILHAHARNYLQLYYPDTPGNSGSWLIRNDASILAWLDELNALTPNGVQVTRADVTFDSLARLIARFMYMATVQHELMGSFVWDYQLWTHRQPVRIYKNGKREPLDVYQRLVNANYNLNVQRRELIHDFSYLALDTRAEAAFAEFNRKLTALQVSMEREPWAVWKMYPEVLKVNINA